MSKSLKQPKYLPNPLTLANFSHGSECGLSALNNADIKSTQNGMIRNQKCVLPGINER